MASDRGAERYFLQALIHFAVGFIIISRGTASGGLQLRKGLAQAGRVFLPAFQGVNTGQLYREGQVVWDDRSGGSVRTSRDIVGVRLTD